MRLSCNGCRVLRKGCSKDCSIRPCLEWIKSPEAQANATLFLAKFYGRAGLLNLINAGPQPLRPSIFRSLLHESCGRIVSPVYGSAGLVSTESWQLCQAAVEAVLSGSPITQAPLESMVENSSQLFKACDIRHVSKQKGEPVGPDVHKVMNRTRFNRSAAKLKSKPKPKDEPGELVCVSSDHGSVGHEDDAVSVETVEDTLVKPNGLDDVGLDLGLGLSLFPVLNDHKVDAVKEEEVDGSDEATWKCDLTLGLWCASVGK